MIRQDTAGYGRIRQDQKYLLVRTTKTTIFRSFGVQWYFILFLPAYCDVSGFAVHQFTVLKERKIATYFQSLVVFLPVPTCLLCRFRLG